MEAAWRLESMVAACPSGSDSFGLLMRGPLSFRSVRILTLLSRNRVSTASFAKFASSRRTTTRTHSTATRRAIHTAAAADAAWYYRSAAGFYNKTIRDQSVDCSGRASTMSVLIEGDLDKKASCMLPARTLHGVFGVVNANHTRLAHLTHADSLSNCSCGRVENFLSVMTARSCVSKVYLRVCGFPVICVMRCLSGNLLRSTAMVQPGTTVTPMGTDEFSVKGLTEVC
jgi:hypothetical protein